MALLPCSPAIDAGNSATCPASDQRGVARPFGPGCDIGAFEWTTGTTDVFYLLCLTQTPQRSMRLRGLGPPNQTFTLEASDDLSRSRWMTVGPGVVNAAGYFTVEDASASNAPRRIYRTVSP